MAFAINLHCTLSNSNTDGCCYKQDLRPKFKSRNKGLRDRIQNLPIVVETSTYVDGVGNTKPRRMICYSEYCPNCQDYWNLRVNGIKNAVTYSVETVDESGIYNSGVHYEYIQQGESVRDVIPRIYRRFPNAKLLLDGPKKDIQNYSWNRV